MFKLSLWILVSSLLLSGCSPLPVGSWRIDLSAPLEMSCEGVDAQRAEYWFSAMEDESFSAAYVAEGAADDEPQLQLSRRDGTFVYADMLRVGEGRYRGVRSDQLATTRSAGLGGDFSVLLEGDSVGCSFLMSTELNMSVSEEAGRDLLDVIVDLSFAVPEEAALSTPCAIDWCQGSFDAHGVRQRATDPGYYESGATQQ